MLRHVPTANLSAVRSFWAVTLLYLATAGCAVTLISHYDEQIDRAASELQKRMDSHLTSLETAAGADASYAASEQFYGDYLVDLRAVELRASIHPKNRTSLQQYQLMQSSLADLRATHESEGTLSKAYIESVRELFATAWKAIIALEVAKKRDDV